jgi:hypothetical protein
MPQAARCTNFPLDLYWMGHAPAVGRAQTMKENSMKRTLSKGLVELLRRIEDATEKNGGHPPRTGDFMTKADMYRLLHLKRGHVRTYPDPDGRMRVAVL